MATAETANLVARLSLKDDFSGKLKGVERSVQNLDKAFSRTQASLGKTAQNLGRLGLVAGGAVAAGFVGAVKAAGDFEAQLNTINTIARANAADLDRIGDSIRKIAKETGTPLEDLTQGYYDLLSAGIKAADATKVLTAANTLAIGGLSSSAEAVDLLTTAINVYGGDATKATQFADEFAKAIERGKVTAADLAASYAQVAPLAKELGLENKELAAGYATLTAGGTAASEAATQMSSALTALLKTTPGLEKLQKQTGKNYASLAGSKGFNVALQEMRTDAEKAGIELIELVGRKEALLYILQTTGANLPKYNADLAAMGDAAGTASEQMAERQKGLNFQLARLKALALDAGITIGSALLPKLTPLVAKLNDFVTANQGKIEDFGGKLAAGFEDFAAAIGKVNWQPFIDGLTVTGQIAKEAIGLFMSLPPDVQKLAIAALAVNKVTGGLGTSIIKDLAGLALRSLTHINAVNVTVVGANVAGGAPGVLPGGKGKLATAAGLLSKVFLVGMAAEVASLLSAPVVELGRLIGDNIRPKEFEDFGKSWQNWRDNADWPFGQKNAPAWAGGSGVSPFPANSMTKDRTPGGGASLEDRDQAAAVASFAAAVAAFGTHTDAVKSFGAKELTSFRTTAEGAIGLFDERIRYLSGAQGSGEGTEGFLSLIQRDIDALKGIIPSASAADAAAITSRIGILEGILETKKFEPSQALLDAVKPAMTGKEIDDLYVPIAAGASNTVAAIDRSSSAIERMKQHTAGALAGVSGAVREAAVTFRNKNFSPIIQNNIRVSIPVTVRAINQRTTIIRRLGNVAS